MKLAARRSARVLLPAQQSAVFSSRYFFVDMFSLKYGTQLRESRCCSIALRTRRAKSI